MKPDLTISEKINCMERAVKMAKELYSLESDPESILATAKQIYDWLTT